MYVWPISWAPLSGEFLVTRKMRRRQSTAIGNLQATYTGSGPRPTVPGFEFRTSLGIIHRILVYLTSLITQLSAC